MAGCRRSGGRVKITGSESAGGLPSVYWGLGKYVVQYEGLDYYRRCISSELGCRVTEMGLCTQATHSPSDRRGCPSHILGSAIITLFSLLDSGLTVRYPRLSKTPEAPLRLVELKHV